MTVNWNTAPTEILHIIFSSFNPEHKEDSSALFECVKTCRSWHPVAEKYAYAFINLGQMENKKLLGSNESFTTRLLRWLHSFGSSARWHHVKTIDVANRTDLVSMENICTAFPSVETVKTSCVNTYFYVYLKEIRGRSSWTKLKYFPEPKSDEMIRPYVTCSIVYKDTLTHLIVGDRLERSPDISLRIEFETEYFTAATHTMEFQSLYGHLPTFQNLTHLNFVHQTYETIECFDGIFENCKTLVDVKFKLYYQDHRLDSLRQVIDLTSIRPSPNIKSLDIIAKIDSTQSLHYLMKKFPSLKCLAINDESDSVRDKLGTYSSADLAQFLAFCQNVPKNSIKLKAPSSRIPQALIDLWSSTPDDLQCLSFVEAFPVLQIQKDCFRLEKTDDDIATTLVYSNASWPSMGLGYRFLTIQQCGFFLKQLFIEEISERDIKTYCPRREEKQLTEGHCVDFIFRYCPHLTHLTLNQITFEQLGPEKFVSTSLQCLTLEECFLPDHLLQELSLRLTSLKELHLSDNHFGYPGCDLSWEPFHPNSIMVDFRHTDVEYLYFKYNYIPEELNAQAQLFLCIELEGRENLYLNGDRINVPRAIGDKPKMAYSKKYNKKHYKEDGHINIYMKFKSLKRVDMQILKRSFRFSL